jgi:hypothetical protein
MGGLYHADVVRPVSDGKENSLLILFHQFDNKRLLEWRNAA